MDEIKKQAYLINSSAEKIKELQANSLEALTLNRSDFIGTETDGYTLTHRGMESISKLLSFAASYKIKVDHVIIDEPIKKRDNLILVFSVVKGAIRSKIDHDLSELKKTREESMKSQGMAFPDFLSKEGTNESDTDDDGNDSDAG